MPPTTIVRPQESVLHITLPGDSARLRDPGLSPKRQPARLPETPALSELLATHQRFLRPFLGVH